MRYATGQIMRIGDEVIADGMTGIIICDFDNREFMTGHERWDMPGVKMLGGDTLDFGVMIETVEAGPVHYEQSNGGGIVFVRARWPS